MKIIPLDSHIHMPAGPHFVYQTPDPQEAAKRHHLLRGWRPETMYVTPDYCLVPCVGKVQEDKNP